MAGNLAVAAARRRAVRLYLLDTNIVSDLIRQPDGSVRQRLQLVGGRTAYTSLIVAAELKFGAAKRESPRLTRQVEQVLAVLPIIELKAPVDDVYAELRARLERGGKPIGDADLWIAAQALSDGSILVTDNESEFGRVPGLKVENWLRN